MRVRPFAALRPAPEWAARVAAPPYDVVSRAEALALARDNPASFLRVARADIDLPADAAPDDPRVYARARENLDRLVADGVLRRDGRPAFYLYRQVSGEHAQVGLVAGVHVDDYERGVIRRHETTRPDKEDDRTRHILACGAHPEPVLLLYRDRPECDQLAEAAARTPPLYDVTAADGVRHTLWQAAEPGPWFAAFAAVPRAYVADGHHRSAAAVRAARERQRESPRQDPEAEHDWFPAVLFPAGALRILPYHRVVTDLGGQSPAAVLERLGAVGRLAPAERPAALPPGTFGLYLEGRWWGLALDPGSIDRRDPVRSLDVALLQERVLGPVLGIADQRTDRRIDFVGGVRGTQALEQWVDEGRAALAIALSPPTVESLMAVADAGAVMPPKSTWFAPKLLSGLFVHPLD